MNYFGRKGLMPWKIEPLSSIFFDDFLAALFLPNKKTECRDQISPLLNIRLLKIW